MALKKPYLDVPGTTIFDAEQSRKGYQLNQFCMSLMKAANRARFKADERAYLDEWPMSEEQKQAVLAREAHRLHHVGRAGAARDQCGPAVDHRVPDLARLVVERVVRAEHGALEGRLESLQCVCRQLHRLAVQACKLDRHVVLPS
mgnify:CR=1 FL=1